MKKIITFILCLLLVGCSTNSTKDDNNVGGILDATEEVIEQTNEAKRGAAENKVYALSKMVDLYYMEKLMEGEFVGTTFTCTGSGCTNGIDFLDLASYPSSGTIEIDVNGKATYKNIVMDGFNCTIDNGVKCSK